MARYTTIKNLGDIINYYVKSRNFVQLNTSSTPTLAEAFENQNIIIYEKNGSDYIVTADTIAQNNKNYYYEEGTTSVSCPACGGAGVVSLPIPGEGGNATRKEYTCPACNGMRTFARTLSGTPVLEIMISAVYNTDASSSSSVPMVKYKVTPPGKTNTEWINEADII